MPVDRRTALRLGLGAAGWAASAALGGCALPAQGGAAVREPPSARAARALTVVAAPGDPDLLLTLQTLQGVLAQSEPRLYVRGMAGDGHWLAALAADGVRLTDESGDVWALVGAHAGKVAGAVLYRSGDADSVNLATSLAGPLRAVAVASKWRSQAEARGLRATADVSGLPQAYAFDGHWPALRHDVLVEQQGGNMALRDYGPAVRALTWFSGNDAGRARVLAALETGSPVLGWGDASRGESVFVGADSSAGCYNVASDHSFNLSALGGRGGRLRQPPAGSGAGAGAGTGAARHTATFVMTDGDNAQWWMNNFTTDPMWFGSTRRGDIPMGWTAPPTLAGLARPVLAWTYGAARPGRDVFLAGPSGLGYAYPSRLPNRPAFAAASARAMAAADLRLMAVIDFGGFRGEILGDFLAQRQIDAVVYWEYSRYDAGPGRILWAAGKPAVAARHLLWTPGFQDPPGLAARLNAMPADPTSPDGYSLVAVHAWSQGFPGALAAAALLEPQVELVAPDVFFARIQRYRVGQG